MVCAYRIDPATRTVEAFDFQSGNLDDLYDRVGTRNLDHAVMRRSDGGMLCVWVDGEGYYKPGLRWFTFGDYPNPLAGIAVLTGADDEGEDDDVPLTLDQMISLVRWLDARPSKLPGATVSNESGVIAEVDFDAADAPRSAEELYRRLFGEDPIGGKSE